MLPKFCPKVLLNPLRGRVTHICVSRLTITGSDNGLAPGRRQATIWTNVGILLIGPLGTNFSENLFEILTFSFTKMRLEVSSAKWRPFCLGLNVLNLGRLVTIYGAIDSTNIGSDNVLMPNDTKSLRESLMTFFCRLVHREQTSIIYETK